MGRSDYEDGGTVGGKCGYAVAAIVGGPLIAFPFLLDALGDCIPGTKCTKGPDWPLVVVAVLIACVVGFGSRWLINRFIRWNHRPHERTPDQVAALLRSMLNRSASQGEIDYFISVKIADPSLDAIREQVGLLYGPGWDGAVARQSLNELLEQVEAMAAPRSV